MATTGRRRLNPRRGTSRLHRVGPRTTMLHNQQRGTRKLQKKSFLEHLPIESLRLHLLSFLSRNDICTTSATCSTFYRICCSPMLWPPSASREAIIHRNKTRHRKKTQRYRRKWTALVQKYPPSSLRQAVDWLCPSLRVEVNGMAVELMPLRKKQQQSERRGFAVHLPVQAHNLSSTEGGALVFDCCTLLKVGVEDECRDVGELERVAVVSEGRELVAWRDFDGFRASDGEMDFHGAMAKSSSVVVLSCGGKPVVAMISLHHVDALAGLEMLEEVQQPMVDDLNSKHGLEGYTCVATIRTFGSVLWQGIYRGIESSGCCRARGHHFVAISENDDELSPATQMKLSPQLEREQTVGLYYRTACFSGILPGVVMIDFAVWDDQGNVPVRFSRPIRLKRALPAFGEDEAWEAEQQVSEDCFVSVKIARVQEMDEGKGNGILHVRGLSWWTSERMIIDLYPRE